MCCICRKTWEIISTKAQRGRTTEKEAPTCEKMIKYEREKCQAENRAGWGVVEDNRQICLNVQANGKPFPVFSLLSHSLSPASPSFSVPDSLFCRFFVLLWSASNSVCLFPNCPFLSCVKSIFATLWKKLWTAKYIYGLLLWNNGRRKTKAANWNGIWRVRQTIETVVKAQSDR